VKFIGVGKDQYSNSLDGMIDGRILPWVQDSNSDGYPVWTDFDASQREVFILNYEGNIETSFDITPYNPSDSGDVQDLTNLILSYREETDDCNTGEVELWGECYNIEQTTNITLAGHPVNGTLGLGDIPPQIGELINLDTLSCTFCGLTGSIPSEIGNLTNLKSLSFLWNIITGPIPPEIANLTNLENLTIHSNQLTGSIPPEIGYLINLKYLKLTDNYNLTGPIPPEIGNLNNLIELQIGNHYSFPSQLTGDIPPEIGNLINLEKLFLYYNQFTGPIPSEIGNLTSLNYLRLNNNQFNGLIPPEIGNLTNLTYFELGGNQFTGSIPIEVGYLVNLLRLGLSSNQLEGAFPEEIYSLINLEDLFLSNNQFSGEVPPGIDSLINLDRLDLSYNQFSGAFPDGICDLINISSLDISYNQFCSYPYCFYDYYFGHQDTTNCDSSEYIGPVWHIAISGSDDTGDGSDNNPFETIQKGIESAVDGDTVLVDTGDYCTFDYLGKNIIVTSKYIISENNDIINQTIISSCSDSYNNQGYINFSNNEDSSAVLAGFFINGVGLVCFNSSPTLMDLNVMNYGGGIIQYDPFGEQSSALMFNNSSASIYNLTISNNLKISHEYGGAAAYIRNSNITIHNSVIANNNSESPGHALTEYTGGIVSINSIINVDRSTFYGNSSGDGYGTVGPGAVFLDTASTGIITNSIFWENGIYPIIGSATISYSDIEGGWEGEGNINIDPLFCLSDSADFTIAGNSPCIGTGENGTNMGAFGLGCVISVDWNFSIGEPMITIDGNDGSWNPGESISIEMDFCNNSDTGHMFYPGVILESDTNLISISNSHYWFYGMDPNSCNTVNFFVVADSSISSDTVLTFSAYAEALNCENQPEYCIGGDTVNFDISILAENTEMSINEHIPLAFKVYNAYPNPFNPTTSIDYDLPEDEFVNITIYSMMGNIVKTLVNGPQTAGNKTIQWNATNDRNELASAGLYLYTIQTGKFRQTKKMILLK